MSRNPYLSEAKVEDPDDMKLVVANNKYIDWREGWLSRFHCDKIVEHNERRDAEFYEE